MTGGLGMPPSSNQGCHILKEKYAGQQQQQQEQQQHEQKKTHERQGSKPALLMQGRVQHRQLELQAPHEFSQLPQSLATLSPATPCPAAGYENNPVSAPTGAKASNRQSLLDRFLAKQQHVEQPLLPTPTNINTIYLSNLSLQGFIRVQQWIASNLSINLPLLDGSFVILPRSGLHEPQTPTAELHTACNMNNRCSGCCSNTGRSGSNNSGSTAVVPWRLRQVQAVEVAPGVDPADATLLLVGGERVAAALVHSGDLAGVEDIEFLCCELADLQQRGKLRQLHVFDVAHIAWRLWVGCCVEGHIAAHEKEQAELKAAGYDQEILEEAGQAVLKEVSNTLTQLPSLDWLDTKVLPYLEFQSGVLSEPCPLQHKQLLQQAAEAWQLYARQRRATCHDVPQQEQQEHTSQQCQKQRQQQHTPGACVTSGLVEVPLPSAFPAAEPGTASAVQQHSARSTGPLQQQQQQPGRQPLIQVTVQLPPPAGLPSGQQAMLPGADAATRPASSTEPYDPLSAAPHSSRACSKHSTSSRSRSSDDVSGGSSLSLRSGARIAVSSLEIGACRSSRGDHPHSGPQSRERSRSRSQIRGRSSSRGRSRGNSQSKSRSRSTGRGRSRGNSQSRSRGRTAGRSRGRSRGNSQSRSRSRGNSQSRSRTRSRSRGNSQSRSRSRSTRDTSRGRNTNSQSRSYSARPHSSGRTNSHSHSSGRQHRSRSIGWARHHSRGRSRSRSPWQRRDYSRSRSPGPRHCWHHRSRSPDWARHRSSSPWERMRYSRSRSPGYAGHWRGRSRSHSPGPLGYPGRADSPLPFRPPPIPERPLTAAELDLSDFQQRLWDATRSVGGGRLPLLAASSMMPGPLASLVWHTEAITVQKIITDHILDLEVCRGAAGAVFIERCVPPRCLAPACCQWSFLTRSGCRKGANCEDRHDLPPDLHL